MKKMRLTIVLFIVMVAVACGQEDKTFKEVVTFEKGFRFSSSGTIQTLLYLGEGTGTMIYPSAGIPISTGTAWGASIVNNSANWNTAFAWGNHAGLYKPVSYVPTWDEVANKPESIELVDAILSMQGVKLPVLTSAQIDALVPTTGTLVYDSSLNVLKIYTGTWKTIITAN